VFTKIKETLRIIRGTRPPNETPKAAVLCRICWDPESRENPIEDCVCGCEEMCLKCRKDCIACLSKDKANTQEAS
jgi:hypothetical protein